MSSWLATYVSTTTKCNMLMLYTSTNPMNDENCVYIVRYNMHSGRLMRYSASLLHLAEQ